MSGLNNTGSNNVFLGCQAGYKNTGSNNVFIGYYADKTGNYSNKLIISNSNTTSPLIYGEFDNKILKFNANVLPSSTYSSYYGTGNDLGSSDNRWRTLYAGNLDISTSLNVSGNLNVSGYVSKSLIPLQGTENLGSADNEWYNTYTYNLNVNGKVSSSLIPSANASKDLGNSSYGWSNLYVAVLRPTSGYSYIDVNTNLTPYSNNNFELGSRNYHWKNVYSERGEFGEYWNNLLGEYATIVANNTNSSNRYCIGVSARAEGGSKPSYAVRGTASSTGSSYGVYGYANGGGTNYALYASATGGTTNYGVYAYAPYESDGTNWAIYTNGDTYVGGSIRYTGTCKQSSDKRLKKDIQTIDGALDKVLKLRGVTYYWKNREEMASVRGVNADSLEYTYEKGKQIGVIAQELEDVLPELVETDNEGFKSVNYINLTPVLIEAVKELKAEKDELKAEKDALEAKVEKLEAQMQQILEKLGK